MQELCILPTEHFLALIFNFDLICHTLSYAHQCAMHSLHSLQTPSSAMYILSLEAEGFRLEGFDGQTPVLLSMDPLLDLGGEEGHSKSTQKKAARNGNRLLNITLS